MSGEISEARKTGTRAAAPDSSWRKAGRPPQWPHRFRVLLAQRGPPFEFIGGHPVLDFNNTAVWPKGRALYNRLPRPADLLRWSADAGVTSRAEQTILRKHLRSQRDRTNRALADAIRFRSVLHELLVCVSKGFPPSAGNLAELEQRMRIARRSRTLEWGQGRLGWGQRSATGMAAIVDRIAWHAGELLTSDGVDRLRCCANPDCGWLFLDDNNGTRRWCRMRECGDRAKSKRYYERKARAAAS